MCGIAGTYGAEFDVSAALDRIAHRGPDGRGRATSGPMELGHVRLAIQDPLPRSDQPFCYREVVLTYVGELWNVARLRHQLEHELFYDFETTGDTEVVAAALCEWGTGALHRMEGQFAMAWIDEARSQAFLARDRWGETPLYFAQREGTLLEPGGTVWSSERKGLEGAERYQAEPVPPGFMVDLVRGDVRPFYGLRVPEPDLMPSARVRSLLEAGTRSRLELADVPVCCLVSGGLDSAAILALAKRYNPDVVAYTIAIDDDAPDLLAAREVTAELGVTLREIPAAEPSEGALREAVYAIETPMQAQVEIATLCMPLARVIAADGFKVVLSGEGADELFGGYGNLRRKAGSDEEWRRARRAAWEKQARGNFLRLNKVFMAAGVEARLPFCETELVELALSLNVRQCPPGKDLLKRAVRSLVPRVALEREKMTFQEGAGLKSRMEERAGKTRVAEYNQMARELFGGLPKN